MPSLLQNLPQGWEVKTLGEVCEITMGQSPKGEQVFSHNKISSCHSNLECNEREEFQKDSTLRDISATPQYDNTKIDNDFMEFHQGKICFTDKYISESEFVTTDIKKIAEKDSILLCVRAPVGIINITKRKVAIGRGLCALKMKNQNNDFLYFYLLTLESYFNQKATGSTFSAITMNVVKNTPIPLPPLEIQKTIVEKLENAFTHIDEAVRHLKAVQTNIPRLKSSLLHSAFSGKLTESQNQSNEVQTLKSVVGVEGEFEREEGATSPFKPLHPLIKAEIPQGWELKTLGEVAKIKGGKRIPKGSKYADIPTQYPYIRVTDFENMSVNTKNLKYLTDEIQEKIKNYTISKDDVYISIAGSIGKVGIIPDELDKANLTENAAKIIHSMNKKYLAFYLNSNEIQSQISFLTKATTQPKLALNRIENLIIKIPPLATQNQIVQILESKFAHLEKLAQFVNESLENLQRLKSSLLNQAFKGELV